MPVPVFLLVLEKNPENLKNDLVDKQSFNINLITELLTCSKWPAESGLVGQGIAIESKGSLFKTHQAFYQA